ncbi:MAG: TerB family tellurite resistance protein [Parvularculaceae bacterium]
MHILIAVLGALAAAFWAFTYFVNAAREGRDALRDVKGAFRGAKWSARVDQRLIETLTDPREAAAVLLYQIAAYDGAVTDRQRRAIVGDMRAAFAADEETAEGLFAFARAALGEINDASNSLGKITRPIVDACTPDERRQLVDLMLKAAEIEGPVSDIQNRLIADVRRALLPA